MSVEPGQALMFPTWADKGNAPTRLRIPYESRIEQDTETPEKYSSVFSLTNFLRITGGNLGPQASSISRRVSKPSLAKETHQQESRDTKEPRYKPLGLRLARRTQEQEDICREQDAEQFQDWDPLTWNDVRMLQLETEKQEGECAQNGANLPADVYNIICEAFTTICKPIVGRPPEDQGKVWLEARGPVWLIIQLLSYREIAKYAEEISPLQDRPSPTDIDWTQIAGHVRLWERVSSVSIGEVELVNENPIPESSLLDTQEAKEFVIWEIVWKFSTDVCRFSGEIVWVKEEHYEKAREKWLEWSAMNDSWINEKQLYTSWAYS
ncbi:hypothetical protein F5Y16DRAFT_165988 [Xylariaceae sp. FL0255]|nr:hypothetical protein F5Y16DRAFT_165988 [Xylariaceae sp. FL0255]